MQISILDLDNTIADDQWRIKEIKWDIVDPDLRFNNYHSLSLFDDIGNNRLIATAPNIAVFTSRPEKFRHITSMWLAAHEVQLAYLFMRPTGDHRSSVELKSTMLDLLYARPREFKIVGAYDDREDIVNMYLARGLPAERVYIHNIEIKEPK